MGNFGYFSGILTAINDFWTSVEQPTGCYKLMTIEDRNGNTVNFVVSPTTYFVDHEKLTTGDKIIGFYDANAPVPLIYPPQYRAIVVAKTSVYQNIKVDYFNANLISSDGTLKLNPSPFTEVVLENNQIFTGLLANRNLIVLYGASTRSIPAQTTPNKIIVMCREL